MLRENNMNWKVMTIDVVESPIGQPKNNFMLNKKGCLKDLDSLFYLLRIIREQQYECTM